MKWSVVYRNLRPVAAFATRPMAFDWIVAEAHRSGDIITDIESEAFQPLRSADIKEYNRLKQRESRARRKLKT